MAEDDSGGVVAEGDEEALRCGGERLQWHNFGDFFGERARREKGGCDSTSLLPIHVS